MNTQAGSNIDQQELEKFAAIASRWWDPQGEFKPLHQINPLRLHYVIQHSAGVFAKKIADIGCGGGLLAESLAREGAQVTGIDMVEESLQVARLHAVESQLNIEYLQSTVEEHAITHQEQYDIVTCMEMLEHVPDPASVITACAQLVKPGGHVFFSTINRNVKSWLLMIVAAEYLTNMVPKGTHDANRFIRPAELLNWIDTTSLQERHITGLYYNPLSDTFSLHPNVDVNYILHTQKVE